MRLILTCLLFLLTVGETVYSQHYFEQKENHNRKHLILVHPTRTNLERYTFLIENNILDPGKLKLVGVYFEEEKYDYSDVIKDFPQFGFHSVKGKLETEELFKKNHATEEFRKIFKYSKGIIFNGGPDIPPSAYVEEMSLLTNVTDPNRHFFEISFLFHLIGGSQNKDFDPFLKKRPKYSILAICLGMQTMNVAAGGDLIQDIPTEIYGARTIEKILSMPEENQHRNYFATFRIYPDIPSYRLHPVKLIPGRWFSTEFEHKGNLTPFVLSSHHQAVDNPGENLRTAATSIDGKIIEAMEHTRFPNVVGVQFHPEVDYLYTTFPEYKSRPGEEKFSFREKLVQKESLDFHLKFWKKFSESL